MNGGEVSCTPARPMNSVRPGSGTAGDSGAEVAGFVSRDAADAGPASVAVSLTTGGFHGGALAGGVLTGVFHGVAPAGVAPNGGALDGLLTRPTAGGGPETGGVDTGASFPYVGGNGPEW